MHRTAVNSQGCVPLGDAAFSLGFTPGAMVNVVKLSTGNLMLILDDGYDAIDMVPKAFPSKVGRVGRKALQHDPQ
jgi:hypothetical protein